MSGTAADGTAYDDAFALLAERARRRNGDRAARVLELLSPGGRAVDLAAVGPAARDEAVRLCHAVAGSAGTFGERALGDAARRLEVALRDGADADVAPALDALRAATGRTPGRR
ncbi:Hpt domain-containing protein [Puerhibacterium puerhi]|uniref:Hpt domain-containing protein n=1 Tax=Puerhibacterium puerhi TaxID=2692623 RepID=UPI001357D3A2|nr:Hpt domain-containing protein [Puerhibacterium puerhi]